MVFFLLLLTAPNNLRSEQVLILGDSQKSVGNEDFEMAEAVIEDAFTVFTPDVVLRTGDSVGSGSNKSQWEDWRDAYSVVFDNEVPIYSCIGNHDDGDSAGPWWNLFGKTWQYLHWGYFETFGVPMWYEFTVDGIDFMVLNSSLAGFDVRTLSGDLFEFLQHQWVVNTLKTKTNLVVAVWHQPPYASWAFLGNGHGSNRFMRSRYADEFEKYDGFIGSFHGHNHWYERVMHDGNYYITTGGGGAVLLPVSPFPFDKIEGSEVNVAGYHYCLFDTETGEVTVLRYDSHEQIDSFNLFD